MSAIGKVFGVMGLFFFCAFYGQEIVLNMAIPTRWSSHERMFTELAWSILLSSVFLAGLITCFVLYVLAKMKEDKKEIIALLKQQASDKCTVQNNVNSTDKKEPVN